MERELGKTRQEERARIEERIRAAMNEIFRRSGWTRRRLAREVNEDPTSVGRWLEGPSTMPAWFIVKFCEAFEVGAASVIPPTGGIHGLEVGRRAALRSTAKLLRRVSDELEQGHIPGESS
jgi:hypothetical protein